MPAKLNDLKSMARETGVFNDDEILVLEEVLDDSVKTNGEKYSLIEEKEKGITTGFVLFGRTPLTDFTWDVYWLVVDKKYQGQGIGAGLMKKTESEMLSANKGKPVVIRVETSSREDYKGARNFYEKLGYTASGRIDNFYKKNDGLVIFSKELKPAR